MILHYFKVAWRNLLRYRTQSIISIVGLAVGFACFALATLWIRYEMTYDSFHPDADRIYQLSNKSQTLGVEQARTAFAVPLAAELKAHFPEIEVACAFIERAKDGSYHMDDTGYPFALDVDSCFLDMFNVRLLNGSMDFLNNEDQIALTEEEARRHFGSDSPLGKEYRSSKKTVTAVVSGWSKHSSFPFERLGCFHSSEKDNWIISRAKIWIKLKKGTDVAAFSEKLYTHQTAPDRWGSKLSHFKITPIAQSRYQLYPGKLAVQFQYLILFSIAGALVIVCALFNFLSLFVNRLRMRVREMALRKVCGSSNRKLFLLLSMEFVSVLLLACVLGMAIIELSLPLFQRFTGVTGSVYGESLLYFAALILLAMLAFLWVVYYFNKQLLQQSLKGTSSHQRQSFFFRSSMVLQIVIGTLFIFCICVIMKQMNHLRHTDIGMERKNVMVFRLYGWEDETPVIAEVFRRMPLLTEVVDGAYALFPQFYSANTPIKDWEGKQPDDDVRFVDRVLQGKTIAKFYKFRLLQGEFFSDSADNSFKVLINETGAKQFGWADAIGKRIGHEQVIGVIKDFHKTSPTTRVVPVLVGSEEASAANKTFTILMKYGDHPWPTVRDSIDSRMAKDFPDLKYALTNVEEEYEKFLKSESALLKLLGVVAVVCILISIFGIYSFVTLTCERRRKEIAIRKVNGAKVRDILLLFLKEYAALLLLASAIAFSVGYAVMKRWLESYVEQTAISWWVYGLVFAGIACVVLLSIWTRVWKAARQNPAEVIKSE